MVTLQDLDVLTIEESNGYKVTGQLADGGQFTISVPINNHVLKMKDSNDEFNVAGLPWVSNSWLRVESHGQQHGDTRCSIELPQPDVVYGKRIVVHANHVKPLHLESTNPPTKVSGNDVVSQVTKTGRYKKK